MRALIVDDEPLVRNELAYVLARAEPDWELREAESGLEALTMMRKASYDVVFLDVRMPGLGGVELASALEGLSPQPPVVFVTAHQHYALDAFGVGAFDYLLKPVSEERMALTLRRLRARQRKPVPAGAAESRLAVDEDGATVFVRVADVRYIEARDHSVSVALFDRRYRLRGTLSECEQRLRPHGFLRVHRAYLVNPQHVLAVKPLQSGLYLLDLEDRMRSHIPVSRHYANIVRTVLQA